MAASDDQVPAKIQVSELSYLAEVLADFILHSYQNYALFFTSRPMEYSKEHDVLFLREILARNIFGAKKEVPLVD